MTPPPQTPFSLVPFKAGLLSFPGISVESAHTTTELLQRNNADYHGFFSDFGFHNHMVEDLLACYDCGATPATLRSVYDRVKQVQRVRPAPRVDLRDAAEWRRCIGDNKYYSDFLIFFEAELAVRGWRGVMDVWMLCGSEEADGLLARCFSGLHHALIRIGSAVEFGLPALVPTGLAMAASENDWAEGFLLRSEKEAAAAAVAAEGAVGKSLTALIHEVRSDKKLRESKNTHVVYSKAFLVGIEEELISYARQYRVPIDQLDEKLAESISASALMLGAAMRKDKEVKVDFFLLHCVTVSIFLATLLAQDWITPQNKVRLLEWKGRFDLFTYTVTGLPELHVDEIKNYAPKVPQDGYGNPWLGIIDRAIRVEDDGHTIKAIRSLVYGERLCAKYHDVAGLDLPVVGDMWMKVAAMCVDSAEGYGDCEGGPQAWVRGAGFQSAWEIFGPRKDRSQPEL